MWTVYRPNRKYTIFVARQSNAPPPPPPIDRPTPLAPSLLSLLPAAGTDAQSYGDNTSRTSRMKRRHGCRAAFCRPPATVRKPQFVDRRVPGPRHRNVPCTFRACRPGQPPNCSNNIIRVLFSVRFILRAHPFGVQTNRSRGRGRSFPTVSVRTIVRVVYDDNRKQRFPLFHSSCL